MTARHKSPPCVSLFLIAACAVLLLFTINWDGFIQPSGIVYGCADGDPPSYEAVALHCLSDKGVAYTSVSSVLLLSVLMLAYRRMHRYGGVRRDVLLLWGMATITPLVLWSLSRFIFRQQLPSPVAVSMLIAYNDQFLFLTLLCPVIAAQYITGSILQSKALGRLAVFFALMCIPVVIFMNFSLDANNLRQGDHAGQTWAYCIRFYLPLVLAVCSWSTLKAVRRADNPADQPAGHPGNVIQRDTYPVCLGMLWLLWGCIHLAIHSASIQTIANACELVDGPLVDGTFAGLNTCVFCLITFVCFRRHQGRGFHSVQSKRISALWTVCFIAVMLHEELLSVFIRSISYDSFHVYFLCLTGASIASVLPLPTYASCMLLRAPHKIAITSGALACSLFSFLIPLMTAQADLHIAANCIPLFLPPLMLTACAVAAGMPRKRPEESPAS